MTTRETVDLIAFVSGRCPRCRRGPIFAPLLSRNPLHMNPRCPECGLDFEPEPGYFLGAMYASYGIGVLTVLPVALVLAMVAGASLALVMTVALLQAVLTMLFMFRASRIFWLHLDWALDPRPLDPTA